ncbi:MAG: ral stress protein [Paenibacillaceae bacterium]|jgi:general stress protein 26|nr:ral stress protein [Paenibacillaceae bacterium]
MLHETQANREALETIRKLIKGIDTAMLTTITEEGIVSRPMKTQDVEFDGDIWFLTKKDTSKYHEVLRNPKVNVSYADKSYISIRGTAEIVENRAKVKEFWNTFYEKMLETSWEDPNVVLIKVSAETAEYWESGSLIKQAKFMFEWLTGKETDSNLNNTVRL